MAEDEKKLPQGETEVEAAAPAARDGGSLLTDLAAFGLKLGWIALVLAAMLLFVLGIAAQSDDSMRPALRDGDLLVFSRLDKDPDPGELLVFRDGDQRARVARVVAKGGDTVDIMDGGLQINGYFQDEREISGETLRFEDGVDFPLTLRQGELFALFDTRSAGGDSRSLGPLHEEQILGRVILVLRFRSF